jgi:hypothetical protein
LFSEGPGLGASISGGGLGIHSPDIDGKSLKIGQLFSALDFLDITSWFMI